MHPALINFDIDFDKETLLKEANDPEGYENFRDPLTNNPINGWQIKRITTGYGYTLSESFKNFFELQDARPRFYIQHPNVTIPFHTDRNTLCSFNILLTENTEPITFRDSTVSYRVGLLNTTVEHAIINSKHIRILYKISIFDKSFEEIKNVLPSKLQFR